MPDTAIRRVPDLSLPRAGDGIPVRLRTRGREGTVLLHVHSATCAECLAYLRSLGDAKAELDDWDGRVVAVVPGGVDAAGPVREAVEPGFHVVADPEGSYRERSGLEGGSMLIADQWGEVFHVYPGGAGVHDLPTAEEVVSWLRFLAIQCPECQGEAL